MAEDQGTRQADRRRRPDHLPVRVPQPHHGQPRGLRHRHGQRDRQGDLRLGRRARAVPRDPVVAARGRPEAAPGRHRGPDLQHHLRAQAGRRVLVRVLQGGAADPGRQGVEGREAGGPQRQAGVRGQEVDVAGEDRDGPGQAGAGVGGQLVGLPGDAPAGPGRRGVDRRHDPRRDGRAGPDAAGRRRASSPGELRHRRAEGRRRTWSGTSTPCSTGPHQRRVAGQLPPLGGTGSERSPPAPQYQ